MLAGYEDKIAEQEVAKLLAHKWKCTVDHLLDPLSPIDFYALRNGKLMSFIELKCRKVNHDKYPSLKFSLRKWWDLTAMAELTGLPVLLVVRYEDGIYWQDVTKIKWQGIGVIQRKDNRAKNDKEPCIDININQLRKLE